MNDASNATVPVLADSGAPGVPELLVSLATLMSTYPAPWALCGGWGVDAWLGGKTRDHGDLDVIVFAEDHRTLFEHLEGWQMLAHDASWAPGPPQWWDGGPITTPGHIHARRPERSGPIPKDGIANDEDGFFLDIQVNDRDRDAWIVTRGPLISMPLARAIAPSPWGVPTVVPEVLLAYKAQDLRRRDRADFDALLPRLDQQQRDWLRDVVASMGHPWLGALSRDGGRE